MPVLLKTRAAVVRYTVPAQKRAWCHAPNVAHIFPHVVAAIETCATPGTIEGRGNGSDARGNMGWFVAKKTGRRYCAAYNHHAGTIEIRARNQLGGALHSITNATPLPRLNAIFAGL